MAPVSRLILPLCAVLALLAAFVLAGLPQDWRFSLPRGGANRPTPGQKPFFKSGFVVRPEHGRLHAATAVELGEGRILALWYQGSAEGAADVTLQAAVFTGGKWGKPRPIMTRRRVMDGQRRLIRKIGNAVLLRRSKHELWLVFVTVTMGGWAGSSLNLAISRDGGYNWTVPKRIYSAPFFNLSTLVKGPAVALRGGLVGLPVYQEFMGKFAEMLVLDGSGRVVGKARMSAGREALQPVVLPLDGRRAVAFARSGDRGAPNVWRFETANGGRDWSAPEALGLANPNSAITALRRPDGRMLLVFNDTPWKKRHNLKLAVSDDDGRHWRVIHTLENDADESARYSYPWLMRGRDGQYHLFYTWKAGAGLKHVRFNDAWLESRS